MSLAALRVRVAALGALGFGSVLLACIAWPCDPRQVATVPVARPQGEDPLSTYWPMTRDFRAYEQSTTQLRALDRVLLREWIEYYLGSSEEKMRDAAIVALSEFRKEAWAQELVLRQARVGGRLIVGALAGGAVHCGLTFPPGCATQLLDAATHTSPGERDCLLCLALIAPRVDVEMAHMLEARLLRAWSSHEAGPDWGPLATALVALEQDRAGEEVLSSCSQEFLVSDACRREAAGRALQGLSRHTWLRAMQPLVRTRVPGEHGPLSLYSHVRERQRAGRMSDEDLWLLADLCSSEWVAALDGLWPIEMMLRRRARSPTPR